MGAQLQSRNNSKKFLENAPKNEPNSSTINPATMFGPNPHNNKKPTFAYNISNAQHKNMRTSSQTSINSEKTQQQLQRNKNNNNNQEKIIENVASNDYNLLVKLKEYIEELKANEQKMKKNEEEMKKKQKMLKSQMEQLSRENTLLQDKIEVLVIREQ